MREENPGSHRQRSLSELLPMIAMDIRLEIVRALVAGAKSVSALANELDLSVGTVSHHLRILWKAGILDLTKHGTVHKYRLCNSVRVRASRGKIAIAIRSADGDLVALRMADDRTYPMDCPPPSSKRF